MTRVPSSLQRIQQRITNNKQAISRHYYSYMPRKKHHRILLWVVFFGVVCTLVLQLLYPLDRAVPRARLQSQAVGFMSEADLAAAITTQFKDKKVVLTLKDGPHKEMYLRTLGVEPDTQAMLQQLETYPFWWRLVPFSIAFYAPHVEDFAVSYSYDQFKKTTDEIAKEFSYEPTDATLKIENGRLAVREAASGKQVHANRLRDAFDGAQIEMAGKTQLQVPYETKVPKRLTSDLSSVQNQAQYVIDSRILVFVNEQIFSPTRETIASWITVTEQEETLVLGVDAAAVQNYLAAINAKVATEPGTSNVTIVDGRETGRTAAEAGSRLDTDTLKERLVSTLLDTSATHSFRASFVAVAPKIIYNNTYSATEAGLRAYVADVGRTKNVRISLVQLSGDAWTASTRENESIPSASTYKLFIASILFDKMNKGEIAWNDAMLDTTVYGCFDRMTIASTNPCAEEWIRRFGRQYVNDFVHARGFSSGTSFTTGGATQTTAADLTKFMIGLNDGTLVNGSNRDRLLSSLSRHPYKEGVQAGSKGKVYDKVGFLWDYTHDTAIVVHPRGTYVVTIMTKGYSYSTIAAITRELERIMYP